MPIHIAMHKITVTLLHELNKGNPHSNSFLSRYVISNSRLPIFGYSYLAI